MSETDSVVITSATRTAIGTFRGSLKDMQASDLGALTIKAVMEKSNLNPKENCGTSIGKSNEDPTGID